MSELLQRPTPPDADIADITGPAAAGAAAPDADQGVAGARPVGGGDGPEPGGGGGHDSIELFGPIDTRWKALGGATWGIPANSGLTRPDGTIVVDFKPQAAAVTTKSICYKAGIGAYVLTGAIRIAWQQFRGGNLGAPTADQQTAHDGVGRYQTFEHAVYVWHPTTGAHEVNGAIQQRYAELGGSAWGYPITDETATPDRRGRFNHFRDAATGAEKSIYWTPQTGAREVFGYIRQAWAALKWERGLLGYPTSGEMATHDGVGRWQTFEAGILVWHPTTGAFEVHGAILDHYYQLGGTRWGYPITNEGAAADGGRFNHFRDVASGAEKSIYWTQATGAVEVYGLIRSHWAGMGWESSYLGYPVGPEKDWPEGGSGSRQQQFNHGRMLYRAKDNLTAPDPIRFDHKKGSGRGFRYEAHVEARFDGTMRFFGQARNVAPAGSYEYEIHALLHWGTTTLSWYTRDSLPLAATQSTKRSWNQSDRQPAFTAEYFALQQATFEVRQFEVESGGGSPPPPQTSLQQFRFCVSSLHHPKHAQEVWATDRDEARQILRDQLGNPGAGDSWNIDDGECT